MNGSGAGTPDYPASLGWNQGGRLPSARGHQMLRPAGGRGLAAAPNLESCGDSATKSVPRQDREVFRVGLVPCAGPAASGAAAGPICRPGRQCTTAGARGDRHCCASFGAALIDAETGVSLNWIIRDLAVALKPELDSGIRFGLTAVSRVRRNRFLERPTRERSSTRLGLHCSSGGLHACTSRRIHVSVRIFRGIQRLRLRGRRRYRLHLLYG